MAESRSLDHRNFANVSGASSLILLLERGLDYVQQAHYAEGTASLAQAREQLARNREHISLIDTIDVLLGDCADYQRLQQALQEVSLRFAEAHARLQESVTGCEEALHPLLREGETSTSLSPSLARAEHNQLSTPSPLLPVDAQIISSQAHLALTSENTTTLPDLAITCFGHFEVKRAGKPVVLCANRNGQSILRYLVARPGHFAASDTLQALFWPEDESEVAQRKLHIAISALRRSLNEGIVCDNGCGYLLYKNRLYYLNQDVTIQTDIEEFMQYYQRGKERDGERISLYEHACCLYTGSFLPEDLYADWSFPQREQLSQIYLGMCRVLADHYLAVEHYEDAVRWTTALLKEDRCNEAAHRQLIEIYAAQGRRSEALQQYQRCERILCEELGVQPLRETTQLFQTLLAQEGYP